jgi:hypothetical protein
MHFLNHTLSADDHLSELEFARPDRGQERSVFAALTPAPATTSISAISKFPDLYVSNRGELAVIKKNPCKSTGVIVRSPDVVSKSKHKTQQNDNVRAVP